MRVAICVSVDVCATYLANRVINELSLKLIVSDLSLFLPNFYLRMPDLYCSKIQLLSK